MKLPMGLLWTVVAVLVVVGVTEAIKQTQEAGKHPLVVNALYFDVALVLVAAFMTMVLSSANNKQDKLKLGALSIMKMSTAMNVAIVVSRVLLGVAVASLVYRQGARDAVMM